MAWSRCCSSRLAIADAQAEYEQVIGHFPV
jgi:hypothetical protein